MGFFCAKRPRVGINLSTAVDWRHSLLKAPAGAKPKALDGYVLDPVVAKDAALVSDGAKAYRAFANATGRLHVARVTSASEHIWGTYRIQNVNSSASHLKGWMARSKGVATAYLLNYLGWKIDREVDRFTRLSCIATALT